MGRGPEIKFTIDQEKLAQAVFKAIYDWGKEGLKINHGSPYYRELIWKLINQDAISEQDTISEIEGEISKKIKIKKLDVAIGESEDFGRGFRQGFEICEWKILKLLDKLKKEK